jgi:hypothetical protein
MKVMPTVPLSIAPIVLADFERSDDDIIDLCEFAISVCALSNEERSDCVFTVGNVGAEQISKFISINSQQARSLVRLSISTGEVEVYRTEEAEPFLLSLWRTYSHPTQADKRHIDATIIDPSVEALRFIWEIMTERFETEISANQEAARLGARTDGLREMRLRGRVNGGEKTTVISWIIWDDTPVRIKVALAKKGPQINYAANSIIDGDHVWTDVEVEFVTRRSETPSQAKYRRIEQCKAGLINRIEKSPNHSRPRQKLWEELTSREGKKIKGLSESEFDFAWRVVIKPYAEDPNSPWGKPGRPPRLKAT